MEIKRHMTLGEGSALVAILVAIGTFVKWVFMPVFNIFQRVTELEQKAFKHSERQQSIIKRLDEMDKKSDRQQVRLEEKIDGLGATLIDYIMKDK